MEFGGAKPAAAVMLNTKGLDWLKAHPAQPVTVAVSNGNRIGNGPRD